MTRTKVLICPYCGETQTAGERCCACGGLLEPLSRQATHNQMGPWFLRNPEQPFQPGCSYETLIRMIERGQVTKNTIIRGPTTTQFWNAAKRVPGVAHLLGYCHSCDASVDPTDHGCHACGVPFGACLDRNRYGLPEIRPLPGEVGGPSDVQPWDETGPPPTPHFPRPAPVGEGRISSFATDDELQNTSPASATSALHVTVNDGEQPASPAGRPSIPGIQGSPGIPGADRFLSAQPAGPSGLGPVDSLPAHAGPALPAAGDVWAQGQDWATSPAMRAMQRKLTRQQHTIRVLLIGLLAVAVIAVIVSVTSILTLVRVRNGEQLQPAPQSSEATPDATESFDRLATQETMPNEPSGTSESSVPGAIAADSTSAESAPIDEPPLSPAELKLRQAEELIARAQDTARPPADRLADYRQALTLLEGIASAVPPGQAADGLAARIEQVTEAINRLEVDSFFNGG